ncbi:alpha-N-acetylglucosaminidase [Pedobacter sp. Hv1]|nr:alpha-N-acetylglucosaminidase [Pedobacter sp. Hv1]
MKQLSQLFFVIGLVILCNYSSKAEEYQPVKEIAGRHFPWLVSSLKFSKLSGSDGKDVFELSTSSNQVNIAASNANAAAQGLGWYLKYYCKRSISHMGDHTAPSILPQIKEKVRIVSPYKHRYALNYCTISYTMSFYRWEDWQRELDWMALSGVNLMLAPVGMEAVWQNTLRKMGYSDQKIAEFICGPAFTAFLLMGNLEGWGGPVSQAMIDQQVVLQKKIINRMHELGIEPLIHGFYGVVPTSFGDEVKAEIIKQGKWQGFSRPDFLVPRDPVFAEMADIYYSEIKKLYGEDLRYFGGDPFHEGGSTKGIDVTAAASGIQKSMQKNFPGSTWVLQGWGENPSEALLKGVDKTKTLVIELFGENTNNWEKRNAYNGTPFIWSNVSNFGEKNGLYGKLQRFADEVYKAKNSTYGVYLAGVGIIPEGINNNPVAYDLMLELGWHDKHVNLQNWITGYQEYRYGKTTENTNKAWKILLETVYSSPKDYQEGSPESIFCARPATTILSVSSWGTRKRDYSVVAFKQAVQLFAAASNEFKGVETYEVDKIDFVRQVLTNEGDVVYTKMMDALIKKDPIAFKTESQKFEEMILMQDSLLSSSRYFSLNRWLQQASDFGKSTSDKALALKNAKIQITYWGPDTNPKTDLHEYAHKEWSGLLGSLYLDRWKSFVSYQLDVMAGKEVKVPDYFKMEKDWSERKDLFKSKKISEKELKNLIAKILK